MCHLQFIVLKLKVMRCFECEGKIISVETLFCKLSYRPKIIDEPQDKK